MLFEKLKSDLLNFRIQRKIMETKSLQYVIGKLEQIRGPKPDNMVTTYIDKLVKDLISGSGDPKEIEFLKSYLPQTISDQAVQKIILGHGYDVNTQKQSIFKEVKLFCDVSGFLFDGHVVNSVINKLK